MKSFENVESVFLFFTYGWTISVCTEEGTRRGGRRVRVLGLVRGFGILGRGGRR